jgi:hypothetical protein
MSEQDQKAFKMYGKVPGKNLLTKMQKVSSGTRIARLAADRQDRKYFDSGDYMMSKAGVASAQAPGTAIPTPEGYVSSLWHVPVLTCLVFLTHSRLTR